MSRASKGDLLRTLFRNEQTELVPFGVLPIHAQMAQRAGFKAFHISGAMASWWLTGSPDVGMMTRTEVIDNARRVARCVDIPVYCDADTGFGGVQNVRRTVEEFIEAGIAGIHIEDQLDPKKAGGQAGIELVSDGEAVGRLNAAIEVRDALDKEFVITARTDGYGTSGGGLDEAIRRGRLYREHTSADVIFFEGIRTWDEIGTALASVDGPTYAIASRHAGPAPSLPEMTRMGQSIAIVPFIIPGVQEAWKLLLRVRDAGDVGPFDKYLSEAFALEGCEEFVGYGDAFVDPTYKEVREFEERFLPPERQRDYDTIHD
ncbi:oxaloacetate decarboxylase [Rhodococcus sp. NPDC127530]|uniref:isocitrate lyase/PEP mutase family protein n=1 Tax=unclassified Rhodococcus (in: high G+C Gram-positive bacteria) TaxID=192944 RepID=UPI0036384C44